VRCEGRDRDFDCEKFHKLFEKIHDELSENFHKLTAILIVRKLPAGNMRVNPT